MKRKLLSLLLIITLIISITGCKNDKKKDVKSISESTIIKIDGIYIDESFKDDNLDFLYIFYTIKASDKNLRLASTSIDIKINESNQYDATNLKDQIPKYSDYYYSDFIEDIYVGKEFKMVSTYKVAKGDLTGSKNIALESTEIKEIDKIKINTDNIKRMKNIASICEDLDKKIYEEKYNNEQKLLATVDENTEKKIKKLINGYYLEQNVNVGKTFLKYKIEFSSPNRFTVSNTYLKNSGTYEVKAGYITLKYDNANEPNIFLRYTLENGDITVSNINEQFATFVDYDPNEKTED